MVVSAGGAARGWAVSAKSVSVALGGRSGCRTLVTSGTVFYMKSRNLWLLLGVAAAFSLLARFYVPFPGDVPLILWSQSWQRPITTAFMEAVSVIGMGWLMFGLAGAVALALLALRRRWECQAAVGALVILSLSPLLKLLIDRPRPPADLVGLAHLPGGLGFPSGHAFQSLVVFGILIYLASVFISRVWLRRFVQASLALLVLAIGVSRVYLGAHWPSDVLGGYLLGGFFLALLLRTSRPTAPVAVY